MGTSTASGEPHSERIAKLNARKKELESLLAAKNEELYRLCVQEARLTGVLPAEAPVPERGAPPAPPAAPSARKIRHSPRHTADPGAGSGRRQLAHRLSAPSGPRSASSSGSTASLGIVPSSPSNPPNLSECSSPDASHDTFSIHSLHPQSTSQNSQTRDRRRVYPSADTLPISYSRHHTITTEQINKLYYANAETGNLTRVHETHFSSSHPDITTRYTRMAMSNDPIPPNTDGVPLIYQYASQLKAHSHHLGGITQIGPPVHRKKDNSRRNTLQRTQTYHLTSHSDYNNRSELQHSPSAFSHPHTYQPNEPIRKAPSEQFHQQEQNFQYSSQYSLQSNQPQLYPDNISNIYPNQDLHDQKVKEKEWYESSLDSPSSAGLNLSRESYTSTKKPQHQTPNTITSSRSMQDNLNANVEYNAPLLSPSTSQGGLSPQQQGATAADVAFESPKNCTVVESGKWIPYREVSKPFEMSDFYKYSTKYRQNNNNSVQKQKAPMRPPPDANNIEHWNHSHQL